MATWEEIDSTTWRWVCPTTDHLTITLTRMLNNPNYYSWWGRILNETVVAGSLEEAQKQVLLAYPVLLKRRIAFITSSLDDMHKYLDYFDPLAQAMPSKTIWDRLTENTD